MNVFLNVFTLIRLCVSSNRNVRSCLQTNNSLLQWQQCRVFLIQSQCSISRKYCIVTYERVLLRDTSAGWMSANMEASSLTLLLMSDLSKATSLPVWIKSVCYFFVQQCVCVCVCAYRSLPITTGQLALALPLFVSHCSSDHLLSSLTPCVCQEGVRKRVRASLLITSLPLKQLKEGRRIFGAVILSSQGSLLTSLPSSFTVLCELCQIKGSSSGDVPLLILRLCCVVTIPPLYPDSIIQKLLDRCRRS